MKFRFIVAAAAAALLFCNAASAQVYDQYGNLVDTTKLYNTVRQDTVKAAVKTATRKSNFLSKGTVKSDMITAQGLCKLACCNLAESFENSASVTVGYADAVTGARQIKLLGLAGTYTQMLDESRPFMRGISSPFSLNYIPGTWMESISVSKGVSSVLNGSEAITGAINIDHKKPTDEKPLFINFSAMNDSKIDLNVISSLQLSDSWSTVLLGHVSGNFMCMDENNDGFVDDPKMRQFNVANRWLYYAPSGTAIRFGLKAVRDERQGGQLMQEATSSFTPWTTDILNQSLEGFLKIGKPVGDAGSVALVADATYQSMDSNFGKTLYDAAQKSASAKLLFDNQIGEHGKYTVGANVVADIYNQSFDRFGANAATLDNTTLANAGVFGEYTVHSHDEKFSAILGLRADAYKDYGVKVTPRMSMKYAPSSKWIFRANGGRGIRFCNPLIDNIGVLSTNKVYVGNVLDHSMEDAWNFGANGTWYFGGDNDYFSVDYFHTRFGEQKIVDYGSQTISFYDLSSIDGGKSFTNTVQADLSLEPIERFTIMTSFRYTDARVTYADGNLVEKPMTSRYKGVLNLQYATRLRKWVFDATASINGPCKVYDFMEGYENGLSPVYPLLYCQVTRSFKGLDIYVGGENLTGYRQDKVIISDPSKSNFDASCVWGPIMGARFYVGLRYTLWKTY